MGEKQGAANMKIKILSCPICGGTKIIANIDIVGPCPCEIECQECGYKAPGATIERLVKNWNGPEREEIEIEIMEA